MDHATWTRIETLFGQALELPPTKRDAFLRQSCGGDTLLLHEVMQLLNHHEQANDFFDSLGQSLHQGWHEAAPLHPGERVGSYEIIREIGQGGMAVVYLAQRVDGAYEEQVAIKIVKKGLDTAAILRRFRHEQQLLVDLRHPGIANVLDGGETASGQPYLVMAYIQGQPLMAYVEAHALSQSARLQLFLTIVSAVQHAHQQLVVHRDLKPANVLVTSHGQVKLLDFGIAKLLAGHPSAEVTQSGHRLMTPRYAAPEQLAGAPISTATDVYQLGILLAEMLGNSPPEPGGRVVTHGLPKDLAAIVAMATRTEPERRYASAGEMGRDVERALTHRPVLARPDGWGYRARKFVQRNRAGVIVALLLLLSLSGGIIATSWQARKAQAALVQETEQREKAEAISNFLVYLFERVDPYANGDTLAIRDLSVQQFVALSVDEVRADYLDDPLLKMELLEVISKLYYNLSLRQEGYELGLEVLTMTEALLGREHPDYASRIHSLAGMAIDLSLYDASDSLFQIALSATRAAFGTRPRHLAVVYNDYGILKGTLGDHEAADTLYREALRIMRLNGISDTANYAQTLGNQSDQLRALDRLPAAYANCQEALRLLHRAHYQGTIFMAHAQLSLAKVMIAMDSLAPAIQPLAQARNGFSKLVGPRSHMVAVVYFQEANIYQRQANPQRQVALLDSALTITAELYGTEGYNYQYIRLRQAEGLHAMGRDQEAIALLEQVLAFFEAGGFDVQAQRAREQLAQIRGQA
jgi:serine/threonine-protein kinase